jgi:hypothetical protein
MRGPRRRSDRPVTGWIITQHSQRSTSGAHQGQAETVSWQSSGGATIRRARNVHLSLNFELGRNHAESSAALDQVPRLANTMARHLETQCSPRTPMTPLHPATRARSDSTERVVNRSR